MAQEKLGLFDTRPNRTEIRIALTIVALVFIVFLATLPVHDFHVGATPGFIPALDAGMLVCDLITAAILYAQAAVFRSRALTVLASGYVISGLLLIPWALTYPGAFSAGGLLGAKVNTTGWIAVCWRFSVPMAVIFYAVLKRGEATAGPIAERSPVSALPGILASLAFALLVTLMTTLGHDLLPPFFVNQNDALPFVITAVNVVAISLTVAAMVLLFRQDRSVLDLWLLVAMSAWLAQSLVNFQVHSRVVVGAYVFLGLTLLSNLTVMLALIAESNRLYARLALSTAARERERDARLMSMDAVAAAIAHEVGQPLTAAKLSASAALGWLDRAKPDAGNAIASLRETLDSSNRTFAVIKSIRSTFSNQAGSLSEFNLNDLIRETASLMDRELAAQKVAVRFTLEEDALPIRANRVQIQRVFINVLTNAVEALATTRRRGRAISIRSVRPDPRHVVIEVSDNGGGISPDQIAQVFEPFFTTKATGTGLGLSLCRTIIEEHGGRMWVSAGEDRVTTIHMQMNCASGQSGRPLPQT